MNYIVLDLEWNQAAYKCDEEDELPFEIIEIGAVKLNDNAEKVDEYSKLIRPQVYPFLVRRTREITHLTDDDLDREGVYFEEVCPEFLEWCGKEYVFCVWGSTDLVQLQRNMAYYQLKIPWKYPFKYLDVQKMYALEKNEGKTRRTLEHVIELYGIPKDRPFHRAVDDAAYTAMVFQRLDRTNFESYFSVDYYKLPKNRFEETTFRFDTYLKFVSREFPMKEELMKNRKVRELPCFYCRRNTKRVANWFADGQKNYFALGECKDHGMIRGRIRIKNGEDNKGVFAVRTIKPCTEEDEERIMKKRDNLKTKRKERRKRVTQNKRLAKAEKKENAT